MAGLLLSIYCMIILLDTKPRSCIPPPPPSLFLSSLVADESRPLNSPLRTCDCRGSRFPVVFSVLVWTRAALETSVPVFGVCGVFVNTSRPLFTPEKRPGYHEKKNMGKNGKYRKTWRPAHTRSKYSRARISSFVFTLCGVRGKKIKKVWTSHVTSSSVGICIDPRLLYR